MQIEINIPDNLVGRFGVACEKVKKGKAEIIESLMTEFIEDLEDYEDAVKAKQSATHYYTLEEIKQNHLMS